MQYWMGLAALVQGLGWMQKDPSGVRNAVVLHTQHARFLQLVMSGGRPSPSSMSSPTSMSSTTTTSSMMFGSNEQQLGSGQIDEMTQMMEQIKDKCNINVEELVMKVGMLMMTNGAITSPVGGITSPVGGSITSNTNNQISEETLLTNLPAEKFQEPSVEDQVTFVNMFNLAVKPAGEKQCTKDQNQKLMIASAKFAKCIGFDVNMKVDFDMSTKTKMEETCALPALTTNPENCTDTMLSDPVIGDVLRSIYQRPGVYCSCLQALKEDIPACSLSLGKFIDEVGETVGEKVSNDFDAAYRDMQISLGFFKSELCVIGLGCDTLKGVCVEELDLLEECLTNHSGNCEETDPPVACSSSTLFLVPPALSKGLLPDMCVSAYEEERKALKTRKVVGDYAGFIQACNPEMISTGSAPATKQESKAPTMSNNASSRVSVVAIVGVIAVAVLGAALSAIYQSRKQGQITFQPVNTDDEADMEEMS